MTELTPEDFKPVWGQVGGPGAGPGAGPGVE